MGYRNTKAASYALTEKGSVFIVVQITSVKVILQRLLINTKLCKNHSESY